MATAPYEILTGASFQIYLAPVGESFPDLADAPSGNWALLGTNGGKNMSDDGITITHSQEVNEFSPHGMTAPYKAFRSAESAAISCTLVDLSPAQYAKVVNTATVTDTAAGSGTAGFQSIEVYRGFNVAEFAMLIRGTESPLGADFKSQYEVPRVYEGGSPELTFVKGEPIGLEVEFMTIYDGTTNGLMVFKAQDEAAA